MVARGAQGQHVLVRTLWNSGFGEGWALYAERVADELQLYSGELDRFGYLASTKFRAARMVLDAGIHTRGMGYEEALAFLAEQSTSSAEEVRGEVNRYISWPGQAPSYMIGNLEILRLREDARARLGERFDVREFHDQVLGHGMLTLPLLRELLEEWTARTATASPEPAAGGADGTTAAATVAGGAAHAAGDASGASDDMAALYKTTCAICHEVPETKAPPTDTLRRLPAAQILMAMELVKMQPQAAGLRPEQRVGLSKWLAAEEDAKRDAWIAASACSSRATLQVPVTGRQNWGLGQHNRREALGATIARGDVGRLELQWSIALPAVNSMRSQPVVAGDTVFLGSKGTHLLALDRHSGCVRWSFAAEAPVHTALTLGQTPDGVATLFFADEMAAVYAVDAASGRLRWQQRVKWFPTSIVSGPITHHGGRLYVPISSFEVAAAGLPTHECCRSHGGIAALDATSGAAVWRFDTTPHAARTTVNRDGVQMWGPSGAVVWNAPTVDAKRGALYFGTGQNSSSPATGTSDAIIALDLETGAQRWIFQALAGDAWNAACLSGGASCPAENWPDFDFGAAVILLEREAGDLLLAGQKSGEVFALDPDRNGAVVWRRRVGSGSSNGGVHHGLASDGERVYVPVADPERKWPGYVPKPGVYALDVADGRLLWSHPVERGCAFDPADAPLVGLAEMAQGRAGRSPWPACSYYYGHSAAAVVGNGVVYSGALDGKLRMLDARSGELLRVIETSRPWSADNGVEGHGGAIDVGGAIVDGGQVFVLSGYGMFGQMPGNVMLVYGAATPE
jgi:polyvinyl alcohol dehydrogenase (cytochrome)